MFSYNSTLKNAFFEKSSMQTADRLRISQTGRLIIGELTS